MIEINWNKSKKNSKNLYFDDLSVNEGFRNVGHLSKGAVYIKTRDSDGDEWMLEVATGLLWPSTEAPVERVSIEVNIGLDKPDFYV